MQMRMQQVLTMSAAYLHDAGRLAVDGHFRQARQIDQREVWHVGRVDR